MVYSIKHPEYSISVLLSSCKMANIEKNRAVLKSVSRAILFCGRQCIASKVMLKSSKPLVILAITLHFSNYVLVLYGDTLKSHMESPVCEVTLVCLPELKKRLLR